VTKELIYIGANDHDTRCAHTVTHHSNAQLSVQRVGPVRLLPQFMALYLRSRYNADMADDRPLVLVRLKRALAAHRKALEDLESALLEFEEAVEGQVPDRPESRDLELLSIAQVCQRLGMGKSWVYRRIHEGAIPSVKLGRTIKVRRSELEDYLEEHRNQPRGAA
jgi:excisionase family DNA binding protein